MRNKKVRNKVLKINTGRKLHIINRLSPGDNVALLYAIECLHATHPGKYLTAVETPCWEIFQENKNIINYNDVDSSFEKTVPEYPTINVSNQTNATFLNGYLEWFRSFLNVPIKAIDSHGFLTISDEEKSWYSWPREKLGVDVPYWIINAGVKNDYTAKQWETERYAELCRRNPNTMFMQIGIKPKTTDEDGKDIPESQLPHQHRRLEAKNVLDVRGHTDLRQLIRLVYNSYGVVGPCSMSMMLATAIPSHHRFEKQRVRANITIGGGREGNSWQQLPSSQYIHTCGMLDCCSLGGCWKSRVVPLGDKDQKDKDLCHYPIAVSNGQHVGKCMDMITVDQVDHILKSYLEGAQ